MKKFFVFIFCLLTISTFAQEKIVIEGAAPNLFFTHTTSAKETLYSLSRVYNQTPAAIATLNSLANDAQLNVGQKIKIPVSNNNFVQNGQKAADETLVPLYHIVQVKHTLYGISRMYNNVHIDFIKEWNNMSNDVIKLNQYLIIGYLKIKGNDMPSNTLAAKISATPEKQYEIPVAKKTETPAPAPAVIKDETKKAEEQKTTLVKEQPKKIEDQKSSTVKEQPKVIEEQKSAPIVITPQKAEPEKIPVNAIHVGDRGYFASLYEKGKNEVSGDAAIFKTTSGWTDGKFYVLMNNTDAGSVVRISANGKVIYAKVLGALPDVKEDNGLIMRISTAGVAALGIADTKFFVTVNY